MRAVTTPPSTVKPIRGRRCRTRVSTGSRVWSSGLVPTSRRMSSSTSSSSTPPTSSAAITPTRRPAPSITGTALTLYFWTSWATASWSSSTRARTSSVSIASSIEVWIPLVSRSRSERYPTGRPPSSTTKTPSCSSLAGPSSALISLIASPMRVPRGTATKSLVMIPPAVSGS